MKKTTGYLCVGLLSLGSLLALAACGGDKTSSATDNAGGGGNGQGSSSSQTGSGSGGGNEGGGGTGGGTPAVSCDTYCTTILQNCSGDNGQWPGTAGTDEAKNACMNGCKALPLGTFMEGANSVGCRQYHADASKSDAKLHCPHAGPGGAAACGSNCEGFCAIALKTCPAVYADEATCKAECANFKDDVAYNTNQKSGNSLACRLYHLAVATTDATLAATHCEHINKDSVTCQ